MKITYIIIYHILMTASNCKTLQTADFGHFLCYNHPCLSILGIPNWQVAILRLKTLFFGSHILSNTNIFKQPMIMKEQQHACSIFRLEENGAGHRNLENRMGHQLHQWNKVEPSTKTSSFHALDTCLPLIAGKICRTPIYNIVGGKKTHGFR